MSYSYGSVSVYSACIYIYTYVYAYIHTYIYIHIYIHTYICVCIYIYIYIYTYIHICINIYKQTQRNIYIFMQPGDSPAEVLIVWSDYEPRDGKTPTQRQGDGACRHHGGLFRAPFTPLNTIECCDVRGMPSIRPP